MLEPLLTTSAVLKLPSSPPLLYLRYCIGTWMHHNIEMCLNGEPYDTELPEMAQFSRFREEVMRAKGMEPYRTEWRIAAPDLSLAGSVDCVARLPSGAFVILDWKRSRTLPNTMWEAFNNAR